ncbi:hypothetical protein PVAP13_9KG460000 [Panicum virgatum]|uniref:KIB1-4 beta-propeller domain-containing protein n=1 Tax=Panicum virgatum TaxID=38727 RepID=A0A8T0P8P4_PANVG|nr:hypothetical protein PVAP13_9KG460000 [Panicum virgatum]
MSFAHTWKQGWMLYSSSDQNNPCTFLHDPRTLNGIELPDFPHPLPTGFECALSDKPTNAGCIVVILHPDEPCFWYYRVGVTPEWIRHEYDVGSYQCDTKGLVWKKIMIITLTSCKGKFYFHNFACDEYVIIEFKPSPVIRTIKMHGLQFPRGFNAYTCSLEIDEEPYEFFAFNNYKDDDITGITLYKIDLIGQRFALEPNCVYWTGPNAMHIFNIVENTHRVCYHPSNDLPKLSSEAFWLLPV